MIEYYTAVFRCSKLLELLRFIPIDLYGDIFYGYNMAKHSYSSNYFRHKTSGKYFEGRSFVEDGDFPEVTWFLRLLPEKEYLPVKMQDFVENWAQCSPYEALGSLKT